MIFVCHVTMQDQVIRGCMTLWHCDGGDMFLVGAKEDSRCYRFNPPSLLITKGHGLKAHSIY